MSLECLSMIHSFSRSRKRGFTLIELLVVVSIIALLIAILIPALSMARATAKRVTCGTNLKGIALAMHLYESENKRLPASQREYVIANGGYLYVNSGNLYYDEDEEWDLREMLAETLGKFDLWMCTNLGGPSIDDESNTGDVLYSPYTYHGGGRLFPEFERDASDENEPTPSRSIDGGSDFPLIQDTVMVRPGGEKWQFNHGRGEKQQPQEVCPSYMRIITEGRENGEGANIAYYDGHVDWVPQNELVEVGYSHQSKTKPFYSTMPAGH
jgi:prepilin-type N-terminal cleavage/methylation domain-containing protein/prepilin-type processing-associated H-X9-DG protein